MSNYTKFTVADLADDEAVLHGLHEALEIVFHIVHHDVDLVHVRAHHNLLQHRVHKIE